MRAAAPRRVMTSRLIHEDASHDVRGDGKEVDAIVPLEASVIHQPEIRLMDELVGRERVTSRLQRELPVRNAGQVAVHEWDEAVQRARNAVPHLAERVGDRVLLRERCHAPRCRGVVSGSARVLRLYSCGTIRLGCRSYDRVPAPAIGATPSAEQRRATLLEENADASLHLPSARIGRPGRLLRGRSNYTARARRRHARVA
jgi:hypothetical protein